MSGREPAWRVLAHELDLATEEERGEGDRATTYLVSPLGARMSRVLLAGTLGPSEAIGSDDTAPFVRSRLTDPTGSIDVTAGRFQPRALDQLRSFPAPGGAIVVGKAHLFRGRDGVGHPSVRAEALRPATIGEVEMLMVEAVAQASRRATLLRAVSADPTLSDDALRSLGYPKLWRAGARAALALYRSVDLPSILRPLAGALPGPSPASAPRPAEPTAPAPTPRAEPPRGAPTGPPSVFLELLDELSERSGDGYANLADLMQALGRRGMREDEVEEILGQLEESGTVEEPIVGKLRRA